ncbi:hypothetical protein PHAVU_009G237500 [Phaseolus vulgaris]|uniref:Defensin-like protein n=1 Tax=Phaseolus vulgaris TaxID=3885 RepID=V7B2U5_PHAVU|nr:hypothetical protein PHAVU_009G237500g [Phaseolus vulgaris]ESW10781.1 hypothetical protein PHAVU_009G237500g [Phaseolus vulgaris]
MVNHISCYFLLFTIFILLVTGQKEVKEDSNGGSRDLDSSESVIEDETIRKCTGSQGLCKEQCDEDCCNSKCAAKYNMGVGTCKLYSKNYNMCICKYVCQPN